VLAHQVEVLAICLFLRARLLLLLLLINEFLFLVHSPLLYRNPPLIIKVEPLKDFLELFWTLASGTLPQIADSLLFCLPFVGVEVHAIPDVRVYLHPRVPSREV